MIVAIAVRIGVMTAGTAAMIARTAAADPGCCGGNP
jgi:hypothetical protein